METLTLSWAQIGALIASFTGVFAFFIRRMDKKFDRMDLKFERMDKKLDSKFHILDSKIDRLGERIGRVENRLTAIETILPYVTPNKVFRFEESNREEPKEN